MKVSLLKVTKHELKIEIEGEGSTLLNLLQKTLLKNKKVGFAGYAIPHRLVEKSIFHVRTSGDLVPVKALLKALEELKNETEAFKKNFKKALKDYEERGTD